MKRVYWLILILLFILAATPHLLHKWGVSCQIQQTYFYIDKIYEIIPMASPSRIHDKVGTNQYEYTNKMVRPDVSSKLDDRLKSSTVENLPQQVSEIDLDVPFTCQAPFANWDQLHNEACEEAAVIMVHYYLQGADLTREKADKEIVGLVNWQIENWGGHHHLPVSEVAKLFQYYGYTSQGPSLIKVSYDISLEDIKRELEKGRPVIVPTAGRQLGNPYYKRPGPLYHMLVIRGFEQDEFITNDPGTKWGESFRYQEDVLFQAIRDLPPGGEKEILSGRKVMLVP